MIQAICFTLGTLTNEKMRVSVVNHPTQRLNTVEQLVEQDLKPPPRQHRVFRVCLDRDLRMWSCGMGKGKLQAHLHPGRDPHGT